MRHPLFCTSIHALQRDSLTVLMQIANMAGEDKSLSSWAQVHGNSLLTLSPFREVDWEAWAWEALANWLPRLKDDGISITDEPLENATIIQAPMRF